MGPCLSQPLAQRFHCEDAYVLRSLIAKGGQGTVWLASPVGGEGDFALKAMERGLSRQNAAALAREVQCSLAVGAAHVNVVRPHELLLTNSHVLLAMGLSRGGSLEAYVKREPVSEPLARFFFRQICAALRYCHSQGVSFRDLKLANVLLDGHNPPWVQLCDFGVATTAPKASGEKRHDTLVGTPGYIAPQVLGVAFDASTTHGYDGCAADVWSAGICLFAMLSNGSLPFNFDQDFDRIAEEQGLSAALRNSWQREKSVPCDKNERRGRFSKELADLLDQLLEPDEAKRIDFSAALAHPWTAAPLSDECTAALAEQEAEQGKLGQCDAECGLHDTDALIEATIMRAVKVPGKGEGEGIEARVGLWPEECEKRTQRAGSVTAAPCAV